MCCPGVLFPTSLATYQIFCPYGKTIGESCSHCAPHVFMFLHHHSPQLHIVVATSLHRMSAFVYVCLNADAQPWKVPMPNQQPLLCAVSLRSFEPPRSPQNLTMQAPPTQLPLVGLLGAFSSNHSAAPLTQFLPGGTTRSDSEANDDTFGALRKCGTIWYTFELTCACLSSRMCLYMYVYVCLCVVIRIS